MISFALIKIAYYVYSTRAKGIFDPLIANFLILQVFWGYRMESGMEGGMLSKSRKNGHSVWTLHAAGITPPHCCGALMVKAGA